MNRNNQFNFLSIIISAMILVRSFVVVILLASLFSITQNPQQVSPPVEITPPPIQLPSPTVLIPTLAVGPADAALANSEWSGAQTIKTPVIDPTPFIIPTRIPTEIAAQNSTSNNNTAALQKPATILINSPLDGFQIADLQELISQEFKAPPPGEDSGHHGVDFAYWSRDNKPILGVPILAALPGKVIMSGTQEKPPYGYAIVVETPLNQVSPVLIQSIKIPTQSIGTNTNNKLNCPDLTHDQWNTTSKSLYTLYGHLLNPPAYQNGDVVQFGQTLGNVGNSGYSSAPHLHLEMRIGPSGATFTNMGHYDPVTTEEDRHNYCSWRISGVFQLFDPMDLYKASLAIK